MVKHTQIIRQQQPTICLSVFDHLWDWRLFHQFVDGSRYRLSRYNEWPILDNFKHSIHK